jgi:hypothetical protein
MIRGLLLGVMMLIDTANINTCDIDNLYAKSMLVYEVDREYDILYLTDSNGNGWEYVGIEDLGVGDVVDCLMYDNQTDIIYDDKIIKLQYSGFTAEG